MIAFDEEADLTEREVIDRRLVLSACYLGWSPPRIAAFREGWKAALAGEVDDVILHLHDGDSHGYTEAGLNSFLLESLGYRDGVRAFESRSVDPTDYSFSRREELLEIASQWSCNENDDFDVDEAEWSSSTAESIAPFLTVMSREDWISWLVREHQEAIEDGRPGYGDLLLQDVNEAIIYVAYRDGHVDIWDGWHRVAASMLKGAGTIPAIKGVPAPGLSPHP